MDDRTARRCRGITPSRGYATEVAQARHAIRNSRASNEVAAGSNACDARGVSRHRGALDGIAMATSPRLCNACANTIRITQRNAGFEISRPRAFQYRRGTQYLFRTPRGVLPALRFLHPKRSEPINRIIATEIWRRHKTSSVLDQVNCPD